MKKRRRKSHYHTGIYVSTKTGQICKHRSGWERSYMQYLDAEPSVKTWSYESFTIDYVSNKKTQRIRHYIPDFKVEYVNGDTVIVEIKPSRRLTKPTVKKKMAAAVIWCGAHGVALKIVTEVDLKSLGLL
jgi:hypothetical protein